MTAAVDDRPPAGITRGEDGIDRCAWAGAAVDLRDYHDREWGFPVGEDRHLFEKLSLEGFQSGLSWLTILRKRPALRAAFAAFDLPTVAAYGPDDVDRLLQDAGIIRHRGKIEAVIHNAGRALELIGTEGSLGAFLWSYAPRTRVVSTDLTALAAQTTTPESTALARELKRRGWRFVGPTTAHAFMQSMGLVNDHLGGCAAHDRVARARAAFTPPR